MLNEPRPDFKHQPTSNTLVQDGPTESNSEDPSDPNVEGGRPPSNTHNQENLSEPKGEDTPDPNVEGGQPPSNTHNQENLSEPKVKDISDPNVEGAPSPGSGRFYDMLVLFGIFIMLIWPWIFFGVVWAKKGIQMNNHVAKVVTNNPHATTYFITLICSIISMIVSAFFSLAIIRFAQELVSRPKPTRPFHLRVLLAFRHQNWPWGKSLKDVKYLMDKTRWWPAALVVICVLTFPHLISSTTSLITPAPFNRTAILNGNELDFSSTEADCLAWFDAHPLSNNCDWQQYKDLYYTNCLGENQMVDVLEAGRGNILELLSNNSQSLTFSQLGAKDGLHFLGPLRGVLPIGPNGVPAFNTLQPSPFENPKIVAGMTSYDYTLNHQGLTSNIRCSYEPESPIVLEAVIPGDNLAMVYNADCTKLGEAEVLTNTSNFQSVNGNNTLTYWACQSASGSQTPSYSIYLRGLNLYQPAIGNIACTVSPIQPAIFPVTYQSTAGIFSAKEPNASSPITFSRLINYALIGLGEVISEGQNFQANLFAESVITFGVKSFGQQPYEQSPEYLRLYEQMIQGILEYHTTYLRLIYSTASPPPSCNRIVTGSLNYVVLGWFVTSDNIGFLIPMTIINLAALVALILAAIIAKAGGYKFKPSDPRPITWAEDGDEEQLPDEWKEKVAYQPTTVFKEYFDSCVKDKIMDGVKGGAKAAGEVAMEDVEKAIPQRKEMAST